MNNEIETINGVKGELEAKKETIKGLDRATVEYTRIIADKEAIIKALNERIAYLEEAQASRGETKQITKEEWQENFK